MTLFNERSEMNYNFIQWTKWNELINILLSFISTDVKIYIKMVLLVLHSTVEKRKNNMNEFENVVLCYDASSVGSLSSVGT